MLHRQVSDGFTFPARGEMSVRSCMHGLGGLTVHETTCTVNYWIALLFLPVTFLTVFVFVFLLLSLFVYFFFCCWRCTPLQFSSDCLNNPTSFLFISVLLDVWSLDALVLHESVQCTVFPAQ